ncbi:hypothetical protein [Streptomyces sp. NPDC005423]|uniref:hypothetical protein n=1 Tax=Streptomyces sp. NPDC005423 TaxID=3155343 RepID=UPI0033BCDBEF
MPDGVDARFGDQGDGVAGVAAPMLSFAIEESVLRRPIGGRPVVQGHLEPSLPA